MKYSALPFIALASAIAATLPAYAQMASPSSRLETVTVTGAKPDLAKLYAPMSPALPPQAPTWARLRAGKAAYVPR